VSLLIGCFGGGAMTSYLLQWTNVMALAIQLALLPLVAHRLGLGPAPGIVAALAWLTAGIPVAVTSEATLAGTLIVLVTCCMAMFSSTQRVCPARIVLTGILWGLLLLLTPVVLLVLCAWLLSLIPSQHLSRRQKLVLAILPLVVISPWLIRNYRVFHEIVFVRDNLGLELAVSNNSCAAFSYEKNLDSGCYRARHPNENIAEVQSVQQLGEVGYNHAKLAQARSWIGTHPTRFLVLTMERFAAFWFPAGPASDELSSRQTLVVYLFTLLSIPGLWCVLHGRRHSALLLSLWLALFPLIYYVTQFNSRFRQPIMWVTFLLGSHVLTLLARPLAHALPARQFRPAA
jgi:hypothetical protein